MSGRMSAGLWAAAGVGAGLAGGVIAGVAAKAEPPAGTPGVVVEAIEPADAGGAAPESSPTNAGESEGAAREADQAAAPDLTEGLVVERVRGAEVGQAELRGEVWVWMTPEGGAMRTGAALPVGYPAPTPPGALEVKAYPSVRRAEADGEAWLMGSGQGGAFWKLFRHISEREIAMTAPVEMDYSERGADGTWPGLKEFTMSFLYRDAELGPVGEDGRGVRVVDAEPVTVLAMGMQGDPSRAEFEAAFAELEKVAAGLEGWKVGDRRRSFGYNGPEQRSSLRWWEAQVELVRGEGEEQGQ